MKKLFKKSDDKGFTLIELLIVIIIIGILAAIAFVAYNGTQNKAKQSAAQSTVSEAQSKLAEYNGDNGYYPTTLATFDTWLASSTGGSNTSLSTLFVGPAYTYTPTPTSCDDNVTNCTAYTITYTYTASNGGGTANITATN
jgi:prepilin-type N-terminal cleavage/methylation domain-containing protein